MCLAIPSKIIQIDDNIGTIDVDGVKRKTSLLLLEDAKIGDYVIVHAGFAIQKLSVDEAQETIRLFNELVAREKELDEGQ